jgi:hypothetical protein
MRYFHYGSNRALSVVLPMSLDRKPRQNPQKKRISGKLFDTIVKGGAFKSPQIIILGCVVHPGL